MTATDRGAACCCQVPQIMLVVAVCFLCLCCLQVVGLKAAKMMLVLWTYGQMLNTCKKGFASSFQEVVERGREDRRKVEEQVRSERERRAEAEEAASELMSELRTMREKWEASEDRCGELQAELEGLKVMHLADVGFWVLGLGLVHRV